MANENEQDYSDVAVLLPCYNEEPTVAKVVRDFQAALPGATVWVFDNNSADRTADLAREAGATVVASTRQGKGNVVQHMFQHVDANVYVMADGDDTYLAEAAPQLVQAIRAGEADMVVGERLAQFDTNTSFRRFHQFGNRTITSLIRRGFGVTVNDVLSGYRGFSREFVKTIPLAANGFEIETELTLQAATKDYVLKEIPVRYGTRPEGSFSKLSTFGDGFLILRLILMILKDYRPWTFFGAIAVLLGLCSLAAGARPIVEYIRNAYVYAVPSAILAAGLGVLAVICLGIGLTLDTISKYHNENFRVWKKIARQLDQ